MITKYKLFIRPACDECMKIQAYMEKIKLKGETIDVAQDEGAEIFSSMLKLAEEQGFNVRKNNDGTFSFPICFFFQYGDIEKIAYNTDEAEKIVENKSLFDIV